MPKVSHLLHELPLRPRPLLPASCPARILIVADPAPGLPSLAPPYCPHVLHPDPPRLLQHL
eukprot:766858-Hanusia_phi.AAC.3